MKVSEMERLKKFAWVPVRVGVMAVKTSLATLMEKMWDTSIG